jgi:hypothetical protein
VMLEGIAFLAIVVAAITSTFVARAAKERDIAQAADEDAARCESRPGWTASSGVSTGSNRCFASTRD